MELRKVTAIVRADLLEKVEQRLKKMGVKGVSITQVKRFGEYANFFRHDWLVRHARIEIFAKKERAEELARAIAEEAHTGLPGDGIIGLLPVEEIIRIRTQSGFGSDDPDR
jgi:nitrogen regulatory protein P-II 1